MFLRREEREGRGDVLKILIPILRLPSGIRIDINALGTSRVIRLSKPIRLPPVLEDGLVLDGCGVRFIAAVFLAPVPAREWAGVDEGSAAVVLCRIVCEERLC